LDIGGCGFEAFDHTPVERKEEKGKARKGVGQSGVLREIETSS
jgi:hypothetical protein